MSGTDAGFLRRPSRADVLTRQALFEQVDGNQDALPDAEVRDLVTPDHLVHLVAADPEPNRCLQYRHRLAGRPFETADFHF
jgi:hypothetical protein